MNEFGKIGGRAVLTIAFIAAVACILAIGEEHFSYPEIKLINQNSISCSNLDVLTDVASVIDNVIDNIEAMEMEVVLKDRYFWEAVENIEYAVPVYSPVVEAYNEFEKSGFRIYDNDLTGDSLLAIGKDWDSSLAGLGVDIHAIQLQYALLDVSGDKIPEMLVGVMDLGRTYIFGIYAIKENTAAAILQKPNSHTNITILSGYVVRAGWAQMGNMEDLYYQFEGGGEKTKTGIRLMYILRDYRSFTSGVSTLI